MCDTVTVLLGDIVLSAFEKILVLFSGHRKNCIFYNCTNFCLQLQKIFTTAQSVHCTLKNPETHRLIVNNIQRTFIEKNATNAHLS